MIFPRDIFVAIALLFGLGYAVAQSVGPLPTGQPFTGNPSQQIGAHQNWAGPVPVLSGCGTGPTIAGSDVAGHVVPGTSATACTITFAGAWNSRPTCVLSSGGMTIAYEVSATALTINPALAGVRFGYLCFGRAGG